MRRTDTWRSAGAAIIVAGAVLLVGCGRDSGTDPQGSAAATSTTATTTATSTSTTPATTPPTTVAPTAAPSTAAATTAPSRTSAGAAATAEHVFPVRAAGGGTATYARSHHDYPAADIFAPCGSEVVAVTNGVVQELSRTDNWNSKVNSGDTRGGLFVSLVGADGVRYYGSHMREVDPSIEPGTAVRSGQRLGAVGDTGDAKGVGCHLHFGLSAPCGPADWQRRRGEVWPQKYLDSWRAGGTMAPASEITARRC